MTRARVWPGSALFQGDAHPLALRVEDRIEIRIPRDGRHLVGGHVYVVGQDQAARPDQRQKLVRVIDVALLVGVDGVGAEMGLCRFR
jgi:hypothetical protein